MRRLLLLYIINGETYINAQDQIGGYNDEGGASRFFPPDSIEDQEAV